MDRWLVILGLLALTSVLCLAGNPSYTVHPVKNVTTSTAAEPTSTPAPATSSSTKKVEPTPSSTIHTSTPVPSSNGSTATHSSSKSIAPTPTSTKNSTATPTPTPPPSNKTSTVAPKSTHVVVTPTPAPPPPTKPTVPQYILKNNNDSNCIVMNATMNFIVGYHTASKDSKNKTVNGFKYLNISLTDANVNKTASYCNIDGTFEGDLKSLLQLYWMCGKGEECHVDFAFFASKNDSAQQWNLNTTTVYIPGGVFVEAQHPVALEGVAYKVMDQMLDYQQSYSCNSERNVTADVSDADYNMTITVQHFQVQAFQFNPAKDSAKYGFDRSASCAADSQDNKIVPIAVGAALAGLVIIVLIAYIIGRLRSRKQSSYEALS